MLVGDKTISGTSKDLWGKASVTLGRWGTNSLATVSGQSYGRPRVGSLGDLPLKRMVPWARAPYPGAPFLGHNLLSGSWGPRKAYQSYQ